MNVFDFFHRKACLTCDPAEWEIGYRELARVGLYDVIKFDALPDIGPHQSFNRSLRQMLIDFYDSGAQTFLMLEDDCEFKDLEHLEQALTEVPRDWDLLYLGANIRGDVLRITEHIFKLTDAWTTHCLGFNRKVVPYLLKFQPHISEQMADNWIGSQLGRLNGYVVAPMVAWQRPRWSVIWDKEVDYTEVFTLSEEKLI